MADPGMRAQLRWESQDNSSAEMIVKASSNITVVKEASTFLPEYGLEKLSRSLLLSGSVQLPFSWTAQWKLRKAA